MESKLLPSINHMESDNPAFIDDSAPCNRSKIVNEWKSSNNISQMDWPGNSPDLNPIENLWSILKCKLRKKPNPNERKVCENLIRIWNNDIDKSFLQKLADSMPNRIREVLKSKGFNKLLIFFQNYITFWPIKNFFVLIIRIKSYFRNINGSIKNRP